MIASGSITRWLAAVGMCCLTLLGAAPRLDCLCPYDRCQIECEQNLAGLLGEAATECDDKPACCCQHEEPAHESDDGPAFHRSGCHCEMQVVQDDLSPVVRNEGKLPRPVVMWLAAQGCSAAIGGPELPLAGHYFTGLPPGDLDSRAQILRL